MKIVPADRTSLSIITAALLLALPLQVQAVETDIGYAPVGIYQEEGNTATFGGLMHGVETGFRAESEWFFVDMDGRYARGKHDFDFKEPVTGEVFGINTENEFLEGEALLGVKRYDRPESGYLFTGYGYGQMTNELQSLEYELFGQTLTLDAKAEREVNYRYIPLGFKAPVDFAKNGTLTMQYNHILGAERTEELSKLPTILNDLKADDAKGYGLRTALRFEGDVKNSESKAYLSLHAQFRKIDRFKSQTLKLDLNLDGSQDSSMQRQYPETKLYSAGVTVGLAF